LSTIVGSYIRNRDYLRGVDGIYSSSNSVGPMLISESEHRLNPIGYLSLMASAIMIIT